MVVRVKIGIFSPTTGSGCGESRFGLYLSMYGDIFVPRSVPIGSTGNGFALLRNLPQAILWLSVNRHRILLNPDIIKFTSDCESFKAIFQGHRTRATGKEQGT